MVIACFVSAPTHKMSAQICHRHATQHENYYFIKDDRRMNYYFIIAFYIFIFVLFCFFIALAFFGLLFKSTNFTVSVCVPLCHITDMLIVFFLVSINASSTTTKSIFSHCVSNKIINRNVSTNI